MKLLKILQGLLTRRRKLDRFAGERAVVYAAYKAATRRGDTRGMHEASASLQALTHAELRAGLGL